MILLISLSHAQLLNDEDDLCAEILQRSVECREGEQIDVLAAVVDGISVPRNVDLRDAGYPLESDDAGSFEGVSVLISETEKVAPRSWCTSKSLSKDMSGTSPKPCTISFQFPSRSPEGVFNSSSGTRNGMPMMVKMPLANTLFQNGQTSTMFAQRWVRGKTVGSKAQMHRIKNIHLSEQVLQMTDFVAPNEPAVDYKLDTRLVAITSPRVIAASCGNIIRELYLDDPTSRRTMPASTELEEEVQRWIRMDQAVNSQVHIWALVTPPQAEIGQASANCSDLHRSLGCGSRLHRVLSGGGGWGMKRGLLALDPESDFSGSNAELPREDKTDDETIVEDGQANFDGLVTPGDKVSFYIYDSRNPMISGSKQPFGTGLWHLQSPSSLVLGIIPSSTDAMPATSGDESHAGSTVYTYVQGHFGMLSEQGVVLRVAVDHGQEKVPPKAKQIDGPVQTKIDAPFTQLSWANECFEGIQSASSHDT